MKINNIKISNILSFPFINQPNEDSEDWIYFNDSLNTTIGGNGSGKSNMMSILNHFFTYFCFQKVEILFSNQIALASNSFRLMNNWGYPDKTSYFGIEICFEEEDFGNAKIIAKSLENISESISDIQTFPQRIIEDQKRLSIIKRLFIDTNYKVGDVLRVDIDYNINENTQTFYKFTVNAVQVDETDCMWIYYLKYFKALSNFAGVQLNNNLSLPFLILNSDRKYTWNSQVDFNSLFKIRDLDITDDFVNNAIHFVQRDLVSKYLSYIKENGEKHADTEIKKLPILVSINNSLEKIGCRLEVSQKTTRPELFDLIIYKNKHKIDTNNFEQSLSSGEKMYFTITLILARNVGSGFILIDEPELHLHKQMILELQVLFKSFDKQIILATHSGDFIDYKNLDAIIRLNNTGKAYKYCYSEDNNSKQLKFNRSLRETVFYDRVICVEGESDYIFFSWFHNKFYKKYTCDVTIIDIGGKGMYKDYKNFYEQFGIKSFFITDLDYVFNNEEYQYTKYLEIYKNQNTKSLSKNILDSSIKNNSSTDGQDLFNILENISNRESNKIIDTDIENIEKVWNIIKRNRVSKSKFVDWFKLNYLDEFSSMQTQIDEQNQQKENDIFILKEGDLEYYCNTDSGKKIQSIIEYIEENDKNKMTLEEFCSKNPLINEINEIFNLILK